MSNELVLAQYRLATREAQQAGNALTVAEARYMKAVEQQAAAKQWLADRGLTIPAED